MAGLLMHAKLRRSHNIKLVSLMLTGLSILPSSLAASSQDAVTYIEFERRAIGSPVSMLPSVRVNVRKRQRPQYCRCLRCDEATEASSNDEESRYEADESRSSDEKPSVDAAGPVEAKSSHDDVYESGHPRFRALAPVCRDENGKRKIDSQHRFRE